MQKKEGCPEARYPGSAALVHLGRALRQKTLLWLLNRDKKLLRGRTAVALCQAFRDFRPGQTGPIVFW